MRFLLVGFDSAWSADNLGSIVAVLQDETGAFREVGSLPREGKGVQNQVVNLAKFRDALRLIKEWKSKYEPLRTIVLMDQPTIVKNKRGQRPVERIVSSAVSRRGGGVQPAYTAKVKLFGSCAPVWEFLNEFSGPANLRRPLLKETAVFETYTALTLIALGWTLPQSSDPKKSRLPKYNPKNQKNFSISDLRFVCQKLRNAFQLRGLLKISEWLKDASKKVEQAKNRREAKQVQDCIDACICLLVALYLVEGKKCLIVGNQKEGYIIVPYNECLVTELYERCEKIALKPSDWIRVFVLQNNHTSYK